MIMKTTYNILMAGLLSALAFTSCEGFLDKFPETALSPETFYTNEKELTLATNGFYAMLPKPDDSFDGALQDNDLQFHLSLSSIQRVPVRQRLRPGAQAPGRTSDPSTTIWNIP